jgi:hypothetical protein
MSVASQWVKMAKGRLDGNLCDERKAYSEFLKSYTQAEEKTRAKTRIELTIRYELKSGEAMRKNSLELSVAAPNQLLTLEPQISKTSDCQDLVADPVLTDNENSLRPDVLKRPRV